MSSPGSVATVSTVAAVGALAIAHGDAVDVVGRDYQDGGDEDEQELE